MNPYFISRIANDLQTALDAIPADQSPPEFFALIEALDTFALKLSMHCEGVMDEAGLRPEEDNDDYL